MSDKKDFPKYISDKRKAKEHMGPFLNELGDLVIQHMEMTEVLSTFFDSVFSSKTGLQESQIPETRGKVWSKDLHFVEEDQSGNT